MRQPMDVPGWKAGSRMAELAERRHHRLEREAGAARDAEHAKLQQAHVLHAQHGCLLQEALRQKQLVERDLLRRAMGGVNGSAIQSVIASCTRRAGESAAAQASLNRSSDALQRQSATAQDASRLLLARRQRLQQAQLQTRCQREGLERAKDMVADLEAEEDAAQAWTVQRR